MQPRYLICSWDRLNLSDGLAGLAALVANWCDLSALRPLCERKEPNEVKTQIYELNFKRQRPIIWRIKKTIHNRIILSRLTKEKRLNSTTLSKQRQLMRKDVRRWVIFVFPIFVGIFFRKWSQHWSFVKPIFNFVNILFVPITSLTLHQSLMT